MLRDFWHALICWNIVFGVGVIMGYQYVEQQAGWWAVRCV
jgi:hypothetical protein